METNKPQLRYVVIDNFYNAEELNIVCNELNFLKQYAKIPSEIYSSPNLRTGTGLQLDEFFKENRGDCKILTLNRKLFNKEIVKKAVEIDASYLHLNTANCDSTLINYYSDGEEYGSHFDEATISALTFFGFGSFAGGDLYFPQFKETIKFKNNRLVIFPSCVIHKALPIYANDESYRVSIAQFLKYKN